MEVVSTSNLVSSENEKTTTACNFQTMAMNSFVMAHDLMRGQIRSYAYMQEWSYSKFYDSRTKKNTLRNTYTQNSKIKNDQQKVERRNLLYFENALFFAIIC